MNRFRALILLPLTTFALAGCQTMEGAGGFLPSFDLPSFDPEKEGRVTIIPQGDCPAVSRVAELSSLYQFTNPARPGPASEISEAHITRVTSKCGKSGGNLKLDINVTFDGGLGPKGRIRPGDKPSFAYPYFVAITNDRNQILSKEIFAVSFSYDTKGMLQMQSESLSQVVPLAGEDPKTYRILLGFQLSPEELAYNRRLDDSELGKSLTVSTKTPGSTVGF